MNELMIDIEALGEVVTQIGIAAFSFEGKRDEGIGLNLNRKEQIAAGLKLELGSVEFWLKQSKCSWIKDLVGVDKAIQAMSEYCNLHGIKRVWCHNYDIQHLDKLGCAFNHKMPWSYRQWMDLRTTANIAAKLGWKWTRAPVPHDALGDVHYQIDYLTSAWNFIKGNRDEK